MITSIDLRFGAVQDRPRTIRHDDRSLAVRRAPLRSRGGGRRPSARSRRSRISASASAASPWSVSASVRATSATASRASASASSWLPRRARRRARTPRQIAWVAWSPRRRSARLTRSARSALVVAGLRIERLREHPGGRGQQRVLAHRGEPLVVRAQRARRRPGRRRASRPAPRGGARSSAGRPTRRASCWPRDQRRASPKSPVMARSSASGRSVTATATGLARTSSAIATQRRMASGDRHRPERGGRGRQPRISRSSRRRRPGGRAPRPAATRRRRSRSRSPSSRSTRAGATPGTTPRSSSRTAGPASAARRAGPVPEPGSACRRTSSRSTCARPSAGVAGRARPVERRGEDALRVRSRPASNSATPSAAADRRRGVAGAAARLRARAARLPPMDRRGGARSAPRSPAVAPPPRRRRGRRPDRARRGSGTPARGGSRRSRPRGPPCPAASPPAARAARARAALRQAVVGDVADEHVGEAEGVLARVLGALGVDELAARERGERRRECVRAEKRGDGAAVEAAAVDGGALEQRRAPAGRAGRGGPRARASIVGGRSSVARPADVRQELLEEQRVALRLLDEAPRREPVRRPAPSRACSASTASSGSRPTTDALAAALPTPAARSSSSGAQGTRAGSGRRSKRDDVVDQVEQRRLGPVDVVDDDHQRALARQPPRRAGARPRTSPRVAPARRSDRPRRGSRARLCSSPSAGEQVPAAPGRR